MLCGATREEVSHTKSYTGESQHSATPALSLRWGRGWRPCFQKAIGTYICTPLSGNESEGTEMDATELKAKQAPLKQAYRDDAAQALITLRAKGSIDDQSVACKVETGRAIAIAGLHPATGGSGLELCSGDMLLEALVACAGVTLKAVATALEFKLGAATVEAEGDLDFRGTLGVAKDAPVGFRAIRLNFDLDTDEPQERVDSLLKLTERYCVVFQTINQKPQLTVSARR